MAVESGIWPLYRFDPRLSEEGKLPLQLDSKDPSIQVSEYAYNEARYRMLINQDEERAQLLMVSAQKQVDDKWKLLKRTAGIE
jgi:pyruvate-ferredoxin/flavodoxin oxidoreductase